MSSFVLYTVTGLGLAGLYFLLASGLSLIFGLMSVLNLAHGAFFAAGGYAAWFVMDSLEGLALGPRFVVAVVAAAVVGAVAGALVERGLVRHLYGKHVEQILLTIGLGMAAVALMGGWFSYDARLLAQPAWFLDTTTFAGASIPNNRLLILAVAVALLV
ncbi:MAG TPA: branched-chain amino acid ABC transporter permease, partial [Acidimicrobiia bacterium]|nr:branched-chain amino acid ABC transporter permease [Acidimicrobiia bacterium]